jgi:hypothetical protein
MEMNMPIIIAILPIALFLMSVEEARSQTTFSVSVSRHHDVPPIGEQEVKDILADASKMLRKTPGHVDTEDDVACNVRFTLKGPIRTFGSPELPPELNQEEIEPVHRVDADVGAVHFHVKVVRQMNFCRPGLPRDLYNGCAFPPEHRSIIVVHPKLHPDPENPSGPPLDKFPDHLLWAHEFGHLTGLGHRNDRRALMTACPLNKIFANVSDDQVRVNQHECSCLRSGPGSCLPLPPALGCR